MSWNAYLSDLDKIEENIYSVGLNVALLFLSDDEILKKILRDKMPTLTEEQIDLIVDNEEVLSNRIDEEEDELDRILDKIQTSGFESLTEEEENFLINSGEFIDDSDVDEETRRERRERKKLERKEKRQERKENLKETKKLYKDKLKEWKDELIETLKREVKAAYFIIKEKFQEAAEKLVLAIQISSVTIPATINLVVLPPWNIPAAIQSLLLVVTEYVSVLKIIQIIVPFLGLTRELDKLVDSKKLGPLGLTLNLTILKPILAILSPIIGLRKLINSFIELLKSLIPERKTKIFRRATRRLVKLGHIPTRGFDDFDDPGLPGFFPNSVSNFIPNVGNSKRKDFGTTELISVTDGVVGKVSVPIFANDESDLDEIRELLEQFNINKTPRWNGKWHVDDYRDNSLGNFEDLLDNIQKDLNDKIIDINLDLDDSESNEFDQFIYNITLQDGTVIPNISEEGIEYYRKKYELLFDFDIE